MLLCFFRGRLDRGTFRDFIEDNGFFRRADVDLPAAQLCGEADVLALLADGKRELVVGDFDESVLAFFVDYFNL